jgi:hypothetical protein
MLSKDDADKNLSIMLANISFDYVKRIKCHEKECKR